MAHNRHRRKLEAALAELEQAPELDARGRTRARILEAATQLFQARGYKATSIDAVAQSAGVGKGTVYLHFRNKAELMFHAIAEEKRRFIGPVRRLLTEELDAGERLRRYVELILTNVPNAPLGAKLMSGDREMFLFLDELPEQMRAQVESNQAAGLHVLLDELLARLPPAERRRRTQAFAGILVSSVALVDERARGSLPLNEYAKQVAKIIVDGVGAP